MTIINNPYRYVGPLDPKRDDLVLVPRDEFLKKVVDRVLKRDEYLAILGPRKSGKTTFLRQLKEKLNAIHVVYVSLAVSPTSGERFFNWIIETFLQQIPTTPVPKLDQILKNYSPGLRFINFLEHFPLEKNKKKIVFLIDDVSSFPHLDTFFSVWRRIYYERFEKKSLKRYSIVITGGNWFVTQERRNIEPLNIFVSLQMEDFSKKESEDLIDVPFSELGIRIEPEAKQKLLSQISGHPQSGHPQLLQHACYNLVDIAISNNRTIVMNDVDNAINYILRGPSIIDVLQSDIQRCPDLEKLVRDILKGEKRLYHPYGIFSIIGAGCIVERDSLCAIRNKVYERFLEEFITTYRNEPKKEKGFLEKKEEMMNRFVMIKTLKRLYSKGMQLIAHRKEDFNYEEFKDWARKVAEILRKSLPEDSLHLSEFRGNFGELAISEISQKQAEKILANMLSIISDVIEIEILETSEPETMELEREMRLIMNQMFFKSRFIVIPGMILIITIAFAIMGILNIRDIKIDVNKMAKETLDNAKGRIELKTKKVKEEIDGHKEKSVDEINQIKAEIRNNLYALGKRKKQEIENELSQQIDEVKKTIAPDINSKILEKVGQVHVLEYKINEIKEMLKKEPIKSIPEIKKILARFESDIGKSKMMEKISKSLALSEGFVWILIIISVTSLIISIISIILCLKNRRR